jgi:transposase
MLPSNRKVSKKPRGRPPKRRVKRPERLSKFAGSGYLTEKGKGAMKMLLTTRPDLSNADVTAMTGVGNVSYWRRRRTFSPSPPRTTPDHPRSPDKEKRLAIVDDIFDEVAGACDDDGVVGALVERLEEEHGIEVSARTVRRDLRELEVVWQEPKKVPNNRNPEWKSRRLAFACRDDVKRITANNIVLTDETMARAKDVRRKAWMRRQKPVEAPQERWVATCHVFGFLGVGWRRLLLLPHKGTGPNGGVTSKDFCALLSKNMTEIKKKCKGKWILLDGASIHTSTYTRKFFESHGLNILVGWPPHSPDMNPIENWWAYLKKKIGPVAKVIKGTNETARNQLWELMKKAARSTSPDFTKNYLDSFQKRMDEVRKCNGDCIGR